MEEIEKVLQENNPEDLKALFSFDDEPDYLIIDKFNLWARHFFGKYFIYDDAPFHEEIDDNNLKAYLGLIDSFTDIGFRGAAKTARTKLFMAFCIANDLKHRRKYIKVLAEDPTNSVQVTTDIYNMLINPEVLRVYPEIFAKTKYKREERKDTFTTATGVKILADTVGTSARGALQEEARPDFIWFEDFENRKTLKSAVITQTIWNNMEEAKNSLSINGSALYNCNYLSERGNVHKLVSKDDGVKNIVLITPIKKNGKPTWPSAYTIEMINDKEKSADDFAGEYMCEPSAGADIFFDRECLKKQEHKKPINKSSEFKIFHEYNPEHRYGGGMDIAGGVGLDSSTSVFIDFSTVPSRVVATFKSNTIKPDLFGDEINSQAEIFGKPIIAPENNKFDMCIGRLKQLEYPKMYFTERKDTKVGAISAKIRTLGWNTNSDTKPKMLFKLRQAVKDGNLELSDPDIIKELWSYTRDDLMDRDIDARLTTRHFDLLMACAIAYMMKDFATEASKEEAYVPEVPYQLPGLGTSKTEINYKPIEVVASPSKNRLQFLMDRKKAERENSYESDTPYEAPGLGK